MNFLFNRRKIKPPCRCLITLSTCWYVLKSKFNVKTYVKWIQNFLSIVNNFNLVIYTNYESISLQRNHCKSQINKNTIHINFVNFKLYIIFNSKQSFGCHRNMYLKN